LPWVVLPVAVGGVARRRVAADVSTGVKIFCLDELRANVTGYPKVESSAESSGQCRVGGTGVILPESTEKSMAVERGAFCADTQPRAAEVRGAP